MASGYVLLVEDDEKLMRMYNKVLTHAGFETICVDSAADAIDCLIEYDPRVVCLDWRLVDGTCVPFLEYVQSLDPAYTPKILIISAEVTARDVENYLDVIQDYYTKPITLNEMVARVEALDDEG